MKKILFQPNINFSNKLKYSIRTFPFFCGPLSSCSFRPTEESQSDAYDDAQLEFENNSEMENAEEIVLLVDDAVGK